MMEQFKTSGDVSFSRSAEELRILHDPACAAAIWNRDATSALQTWLNNLDPRQLPKWREVVAVDAVAEAVLDACEDAGTPACEQRAALITDIQTLATAFADLMKVSFVQLRLDVVSTNACRKFHLDAVTARLICTYRGTGTQIGLSLDGEQPAAIDTVPSFAPILLRGSLWPTEPVSGLLHRSPPIAGTGETRLVLVLDPVED